MNERLKCPRPMAPFLTLIIKKRITRERKILSKEEEVKKKRLKNLTNAQWEFMGL